MPKSEYSLILKCLVGKLQDLLEAANRQAAASITQMMSAFIHDEEVFYKPSCLMVNPRLRQLDFYRCALL